MSFRRISFTIRKTGAWPAVTAVFPALPANQSYLIGSAQIGPTQSGNGTFLLEDTTGEVLSDFGHVYAAQLHVYHPGILVKPGRGVQLRVTGGSGAFFTGVNVQALIVPPDMLPSP